MPTAARGRVATAAGTLAFWWTVASLLLTSIAYNTGWYNVVTEPRLTANAVVGAACLLVVLALRPTLVGVLTAAALAGTVAMPELLGWLELDPAIPALALPVAAVVACGSFPSSRVLLAWAYVACLATAWASLAIGLIGVATTDSAGFFTGNERTILGLSQLRGVVIHPNVLGAVAVMGLLLGLGYVRYASCTAWWHWVLGPVPCTIVVVWTGSRAALVVAAVAVPMMWWSGWAESARRRWWQLAVLLPVAFFALPVVLLRFNLMGVGRSRPWGQAFLEWEQHRVFGFGPELMSRTTYWPAPQAPRFADGWYPTHAHNIYLQALGSGGLIAGAVLFAALAMAIGLALTSRLQPIPATVVLAVLLLGLFDSVLGRTEIHTTFLPLVILAGVVAAAMATHDPPPHRTPRGAHMASRPDRLPVVASR